MIHPISKVQGPYFIKCMDERVDSGLLRRQDRDNLSLYCYSKKTVIEGAWDEYTILARGLIIKDKKQLVALPFPKFFNYSEVVNKPDFRQPIERWDVYEKMDGSLGIIYWDGEWKVATKGSMNSEQSKWAKSYVDCYIKTENLQKNHTYLAEILYTENKIVVDYRGKEGLVLLGGYDINDYSELGKDFLDVVADSSGFYRPNNFKFDGINEMLNTAYALSKDEEGFVIHWPKSGLRLKVKGEEYLRLHRAISGLSPLRVWEALVLQKDEEMRGNLPEEFWQDFDKMRSLLKRHYEAKKDHLCFEYGQTCKMSNKELGLAINSGKFNSEVTKFLFSVRKGDFYSQRIQEKFWNLVRPDGNVLPGYSKSDTLSRVEEEFGS